LQNLRLHAEVISLWTLPIESTILKPSGDEDDDDHDEDDDDDDRNKYRHLFSKSICRWMELAACHPEF